MESSDITIEQAKLQGRLQEYVQEHQTTERLAEEEQAPHHPLQATNTTSSDFPLDLVWFKDGYSWEDHFKYLTKNLLPAARMNARGYEAIHTVLEIGVFAGEVYTCRVGNALLGLIRQDPGVRLVESLLAEVARVRLSEVRHPHQITHFYYSDSHCVVVWFREASYTIGQHFAKINKIIPRLYNQPLPKHAYCARLTGEEINLVLTDEMVERVEELRVFNVPPVGRTTAESANFGEPPAAVRARPPSRDSTQSGQVRSGRAPDSRARPPRGSTRSGQVPNGRVPNPRARTATEIHTAPVAIPSQAILNSLAPQFTITMDRSLPTLSRSAAPDLSRLSRLSRNAANSEAAYAEANLRLDRARQERDEAHRDLRVGLYFVFDDDVLTMED